MKPTVNLVADTICRTVEIGLTMTGAADAGNITIIDTAPVAVSNLCPDCSQSGQLRDHVTWTLVDLPVVGCPTSVHVRVPRFLCTTTSCPRKIFKASLTCADDGSKLTHRVTRWILQRLAIDRMSMSATATALDIGWELVNQIHWRPAASSSTTTPGIWTACAFSASTSTSGSTPASQVNRPTW